MVGAWGSVRELRTGFQARIPGVASSSGKREAIGVYPTKAEAQRALRRAEAAWEAHEEIPTHRSASGLREVARRRGELTLADACDAYITEARSKQWMFARYADTNRSLVKRHIRASLVGDQFVSLVSTGQVRSLIDGILDKGLSRSQALQTKALLSQVYKWLIETDRAGRVRVSPVAGVRVRSRGKGAGTQSARREPFLPASVTALAIVANAVNAYPDGKPGQARYSMGTTEFTALVRTLLFGGLRPEEALSLTVDSVQPAGVWVAEVLVRDLEAHDWVAEAPKSGGRGHLVPLPPVTLKMLHELKAARGEGLLWPARKRGSDVPTRAHSVAIAPWGRVRDAAGMGPDPGRKEVDWRAGLQVKDLRATCASMLAAIGVTMPEARAHLGHAADGLTTTKHYLRPLEIPELRVLATKVNGGIAIRLAAAEKVIDKAAPKTAPKAVSGAPLGVKGHGKGTA